MVSVDVKHHVYLLTACRKKTQSLFHSRVKNHWVDQHSLDDVKPVVQSQQVPPIQIQPLTDIMQISCLGSLKKLQLNHRMPSNQLYNHSKYPCPNSTINWYYADFMSWITQETLTESLNDIKTESLFVMVFHTSSCWSMRHRGPKLSLVAEGLAFQIIISFDHYVHYVRYSYSMFVHRFEPSGMVFRNVHYCYYMTSFGQNRTIAQRGSSTFL